MISAGTHNRSNRPYNRTPAGFEERKPPMTLPVVNCPHCGAPLSPGALVCPTCHELVFKARLIQLLEEAQRQESIDPVLAAATCRQMLPPIPPNSSGYPQIANPSTALPRW